MNKWRNKFTEFTSKVKSTANTVVSASKHKGSYTNIPDEYWESQMKKLRTNYTVIDDLIASIEKYITSLRTMVDTMISSGDCLVKMGVEKDLPESKQNYENFFNFSNDLKNEVVCRSSDRLTNEIIPLLKEYKKEMEFLIKLCDERTSYKLERDHYYQKMQRLSGDPTTTVDMMQRNQEKQSRTETQLQMIEAPLYLRIGDFENRHESIMSYVFDVLVSCQKQLFSDMSTNLSPYPVNVPTDRAPAVPFILNHGVRTDIDEVKAAIARQKEQEKQFGNSQIAQNPQTPPQPYSNVQCNSSYQYNNQQPTTPGEYNYNQQGYINQQNNQVYQNPGPEMHQGYYQEGQPNYYQPPPQNLYYQQPNYYQPPEASSQPPMDQPPMPQPPMDQPPMPQPPMDQPPMPQPPMSSPSIYSSEEHREPVYSQPQPEME